MSSHDAEREEREHRNKSAFKVVDRRRFTASGQARDDVPAAAPRAATPVIQAKPAAAPGRGSAPAPASRPDAPGSARRQAPARSASAVDFLGFVGSLATNAMAAMGHLPASQSGGMPKNLPMAREYLEIIIMLEERTRGNVSSDEAQALLGLIDDLRLQMVEAQSGITAPPAP